MATYPFAIKLDRKCFVDGGVYAGGDTTFTLPLEDETLNCAVLSDDFGDNAGAVYAVSVSGDTATIEDADLSGGEVCIGRRFDAFIQLTPPFIRDRDGRADLKSLVQHVETVIAHSFAGPYRLRVVMEGRDDRAKYVVPGAGELSIYERLSMLITGRCDKVDLFIEHADPESPDPRPIHIIGLEHYVERTEP